MCYTMHYEQAKKKTIRQDSGPDLEALDYSDLRDGSCGCGHSGDCALSGDA